MKAPARTRTSLVLEALGLTIESERGTRAWLHCPFHEWQSQAPTFFVRTQGERTGNYHCFACKVRGGITALAMHVRGLDVDAARLFVEKAGAGFEPPRRAVRVVERPAMLSRRRFKLPMGVLIEPLSEWVTLAKRYAIERGLTEAAVHEYGLGYAVEGSLAMRIVFPARAYPSGEPVSYSARTFVDEQPRYMTPARDEGADLDAVFGAHLWPPLGARDTVVITEGSLDAMAARLASGLPSGALGGSDVRPGHALVLATWKRVVAMTDADEPGDRAARAIASALGRRAEVLRVRLVGTDASALLTKDPSRLRKKIHRAIARSAITPTRTP